MQKITFKNIFLLCCLGLSGCSGVKETLGLTKDVPDEFEVTRHHALEIPADMDIKTPGATLEVLERIDIETILVPHDRNTRDVLTPGEEKLLAVLQVESYPEIKNTVNQDLNIPPSKVKTLQEKAKSVVMFWKSSDKKKPAKIISAKDEMKRLEKHGVPA